MSRTTGIEWTNATWSPLRVRVKRDAADIARAKGYTSLISIVEKTAGQPGQHCEHVSEGCKHCYSETWQGRCLKVNGTGLPFDRRSRDLVEPFVDERILLEPLKWKQPKRIFVENQSDLFGEWFEDYQIAQVFAVMGCFHWHTFQVLTKRPERMRALLADEDFRDDVSVFILDLIDESVDPNERRSDDLRATAPYVQYEENWPLANVWLGVSVEDQATADPRIPLLLQTPASVRFVSYEPALGPVDFQFPMPPGEWITVGAAQYFDAGGPGINWLIAGGESGPGARPAHPEWFRSARDQCVAAGVPFFFKQWGEFQHGSIQWGGPKDYVVLNDGRYCKEDDLPEFQAANKDARDSWPHFRPEAMGRVGKKKAGALLDGREWKQFPEVVR